MTKAKVPKKDIGWIKFKRDWCVASSNLAKEAWRARNKTGWRFTMDDLNGVKI